jgi:hypothetical protein
MAYYLVRLYSGSGDRSVEQLIDAVAQRLVPKLKEAGGLHRYVAGVTDDGRLVSGSIYEDKAAAQRGTEVARRTVAELDAFSGYQLHQSFGGQIMATHDGPGQGQRMTHGVARLYKTDTPADQAAATMQKNCTEDVALNEGWVRSLCLQLDDGRVGVIAGYGAEEHRDYHSDANRRHAPAIEPIRAVFPEAPEEIKTLYHT